MNGNALCVLRLAEMDARAWNATLEEIVDRGLRHETVVQAAKLNCCKQSDGLHAD